MGRAPAQVAPGPLCILWFLARYPSNRRMAKHTLWPPKPVAERQPHRAIVPVPR